MQVHAVADYEAVGQAEADVIEGDVDQAHRLAVEQHAGAQAGGLAHAQHPLDVGDSQPSVEHVLD